MTLVGIRTVIILVIIFGGLGSVCAQAQPKGGSTRSTKGVERARRVAVTPTVEPKEIEPATLSERIAEIEQEVERRNTELESVQRDRKQLSLTLAALKGSLVELELKEKTLTRELHGIQQEELERRNELESINQEVVELSEFAGMRFRSLAFRTGLRPEDGVIEMIALPWARSSGFGVGPTGYLVKRLRGAGLRVLQSLRQRREELNELGERLAQLNEAHTSKQQDLKGQREKMVASQREFAATERSLANKEGALKSAVVGLRAQALRLETIVRSITDLTTTSTAGTEPLTGEVLSTPRPAVDLPPGGILREPRNSAVFDGKGLMSLKGSLAYPVDGRIIKGFGKQRFEDFSDLIFHRGLEFGMLADRTVKAVADGRVMYQGSMPGYGQVVILDHGQRYYSVYGRLGTALVSVGKVVGGGGTVGTASNPDTSGRMFYFEVRHNGKPEDPAQYLKKASTQ